MQNHEQFYQACPECDIQNDQCRLCNGTDEFCPICYGPADECEFGNDVENDISGDEDMDADFEDEFGPPEPNGRDCRSGIRDEDLQF